MRKSSSEVPKWAQDANLLGFLDWLLDPKEWPRQDRRAHKHARSVTKALQRIEKILTDLSGQAPNDLTELLRLVTGKRKVWQDTLRQAVYRSPHMRGHIDRRLGNVYMQRRLYVAYLIFKELWGLAEYRRICPKKDAIRNMALYLKTKGFGPDIYESARKAIFRYKRRNDVPLAGVINFLYMMYVGQTRGQIEYSSEEQQMLKTLARGGRARGGIFATVSTSQLFSGEPVSVVKGRTTGRP